MAWTTFNPPLSGDTAALFGYLLSCMRTAEFVTDELLEKFIRKTHWPWERLDSLIDDLSARGAIKILPDGIVPIPYANRSGHVN